MNLICFCQELCSSNRNILLLLSIIEMNTSLVLNQVIPEMWQGRISEVLVYQPLTASNCLQHKSNHGKLNGNSHNSLKSRLFSMSPMQELVKFTNVASNRFDISVKEKLLFVQYGMINVGKCYCTICIIQK